MATDKIFWKDAYLTRLDTTVAAVAGDDIRLDATIFFAFSGGQESDAGTIGGCPVLAARKEGLDIVYTPVSYTHLDVYKRQVYSFCMCPGGTVVAAASEPGGVVTNGMSQYSRNERNANAGIVVGIEPKDFPGIEQSPLAGLDFQRHWEARAYELGGGDYSAPAQLVGDFLAGRPSTALGSVTPSYKPGVTLTDLSSSLPDYAIAAIREALPAFERQIKGFSMHDAVLTGVETRTSSPLRITRRDDFQSMNTDGCLLYTSRCV